MVTAFSRGSDWQTNRKNFEQREEPFLPRSIHLKNLKPKRLPVLPVAKGEHTTASTAPPQFRASTRCNGDIVHWEVVLLENALPLQEGSWCMLVVGHQNTVANDSMYISKSMTSKQSIYIYIYIRPAIMEFLHQTSYHPWQVIPLKYHCQAPLSFLENLAPAASSVRAPGPVRICSCQRCSSHQSGGRGQQKKDSLEFGCMFSCDMVAWHEIHH